MSISIQRKTARKNRDAGRKTLWGPALYNNGGFNLKNYRFGQAYGPNGVPLRLVNYTPVTARDTQERGILPFLDPLPRFNLGAPGNILRIFEKGGEKQLQLGDPTVFEPPGKPLRRLSERGLGTLNRIDPVFLGLQKTRLHDPLLGFLGSNDHPGDYRSSGCSACHVVCANDRSPTNSGWYSKYGHQGLSFTADQTIPKNEKGHPITHQFTRASPSSQCMNCHMHQGNLFVNPYLGYTWWDQETDGELMYPKEQREPTDAELVRVTQRNPEAAAARGLWGDPEFVARVAELNPKLTKTQFADYHGHGWVFRAVFKHDRKGDLLDLNDNKIAHDDPQKFSKAVHLKDIHLARGMQCADCHFDLDVHGNGNLYGEPRNATTINCIDCHGTVAQRPTLITTGNGGQVDLLNTSNTPFGPRFMW
ncbi:MAG: cytochrome c3 family protein, partial [Verrucomicrobiota bacterium]|nr:cytochrome c3 family protein [Verrucomicrobiota bacterium]